MPSPADLQDVLAKLRERFVATSGNTLAAFSQLADQLQLTPAAPELIESLRRELHRVHGTAGSYGFREASRLAGALELVSMQWAADPRLDLPRRGAIVRQFTRALGDALTPSPEGASRGLAHRLLLIDLPDRLAAQLIPEAMHRGYFVERASAQELDGVLDGTPPQAVIADARVPVTVPEGVPLLLLHAAGTVVAPHSIRARVVDASTEPREILLIAESMSSHTRMTGASILVVDDDPHMRELVSALGEREGMFVHTREDARELEAALDETQAALLLLDIGLPGVNGITATRRLREGGRSRDLAIIVISASTDAETREAAFAAGADDFQVKPVVAGELMRRVERLLELRRQRQVAAGVHPSTGLWMPERTMRAFDEALRTATGEGTAMSLALVRPLHLPDGVHAAALWHRECGVLAAGLGMEGALAGFLDEASLLLLAPMTGAALAARLEPFAEASQGEPAEWRAGIADQRDGADSSAHTLARAAEEGWMAARDGGGPVHRWASADAGLAPDVVVVEDDAALADLLTFALASRGLTYRAFTTGPEALDALRGMRVHGRAPIVILDVDLPGLDGFSLFERLRVERPGVFRVVFLSVRASEADQLRALRAGALDYIAKPVSLRVLMAKIAMWWQGGGAA
jgi:DNA-binding response OmpR family regulator